MKHWMSPLHLLFRLPVSSLGYPCIWQSYPDQTVWGLESPLPAVATPNMAHNYILKQNSIARNNISAEQHRPRVYTPAEQHRMFV